MEKPREMQITKLIEVKSRARPPRIWVHDPFLNQGRVVTSHIALLQQGMHGILTDSKPELFKVSEQKGPILQKSHPPG